MLENTFPGWSEVFTQVNPDLKTIFRHYLKHIYHCTVNGDLSLKDLMCPERVLIPVRIN